MSPFGAVVFLLTLTSATGQVLSLQNPLNLTRPAAKQNFFVAAKKPAPKPVAVPKPLPVVDKPQPLPAVNPLPAKLPQVLPVVDKIQPLPAIDPLPAKLPQVLPVVDKIQPLPAIDPLPAKLPQVLPAEEKPLDTNTVPGSSNPRTGSGDKEGATKSGSADKDGATKSGSADKDGATKSGSADKDGATKSGSADKEGSKKAGSADKEGSKKGGPADKEGATKVGSADKEGSKNGGSADKEGAIKVGSADKEGSKKAGSADKKGPTKSGSGAKDGSKKSGSGAKDGSKNSGSHDRQGSDNEGELADDEYFSEPHSPPAKPKPKPLGVESGVLSNDALKSSSSTPTDPATNARPNSGGGWKPSPRDRRPQLTVDLGKAMDIHGLGTLGHFRDECWVTVFNVFVSLDGKMFSALLDTRPEYNTQPRKFIGNSDKSTWKKHCLHRYYGKPINARYVRFVPIENSGCTGMRVELYGFRDAEDPAQLKMLSKDVWTRSTSGCLCYFDNSSISCACCHEGGCQCPRSSLHQCVQCGYAKNCGIPEIARPGELMDPWTKTLTGCQCNWDPTRFDCACCRRLGCQCGRYNQNQCVTCGHPQHCGLKEDIFGPNQQCTPKQCPAN